MRKHQQVKLDFLNGTWCFLGYPPGFDLGAFALSLVALVGDDEGDALDKKPLVG